MSDISGMHFKQVTLLVCVLSTRYLFSTFDTFSTYLILGH